MLLTRLAALALTALLLGGCFAGASTPTTTGSASGGRDWPDGWRVVHGRDVDFPGGTPRSITAAGPGRLVLINVWASFCGPCKTEVPLLARLEERGKVRVLGVSRDVSAGSAAKALREAGATYPDILDTNGTYTATLAGLVPLNQIPSSVLVRDGRVVAVHVGPFDGWKDLTSGWA
jgi:thiol-disulfide isomerase/thioredoxin